MPDRARAGDEHVFTHHRKRKRRMHRVAEGIEDGRDLMVDAGVMPPDVGHWQRDEFGECAGTVHANALRISAQMPSSGKAVAAAAADHMPFAADDIAGEKVVDVRTDGNNLADKLMTDGHGHGDRLLRPLVPLVDMNIGAADSRLMHAHQHVVDADDGLRNIFEPQSPLAPCS